MKLKEDQFRTLGTVVDMKAMLLTRVLGKIADKVENVYSVVARWPSMRRTALRDMMCCSIYLMILSLWVSSRSISGVSANSGVSRI